jgi:hypothetical protein
MADGIAGGIKPFPATGIVAPPFQKNPFRIITPKQVFRELSISDAIFSKGACDMGFSTTGKFRFIAWAAMGAINQQHGFLSLFCSI